MIDRIKESRITKVISLFLAFQMMLPNVWALTGGPSQPEFSSFQPVEANDVVNLFSGDFNYNIPLMDVEGYPVNLSYSSNVGMEDQASIVGLGWTLNAGGIINRVVRGIPDDFNGDDKIETTTHMEPNWTVGVTVKPDFEAFGVEGDKLKKLNNVFGSGPGSFEITYNNYSGIGLGVSSSANLVSSDKGKFGCSLGLNTKLSTESGVTNTLNVSLNSTYHTQMLDNVDNKSSLAGGVSLNSRQGLRSTFIQANSSFVRNKGNDKTENLKSMSHSSSFPIGTETYVPQIQQSSSSFSAAVDLGIGGEVKWGEFSGDIGGYFSRQAFDSDTRKESAFGFIYAERGKGDKYAVHDFNRVNDGEFTEDKPALPFTQLTYDIFTAQGQGVSGMFHPYREYGVVYDPTVYTKSGDGSFGLDLAGGDIVKGGGNGSFSYHEARSGKWEKGEFPLRGDYDFNAKEDGNLYEHVYFKSAGEFNSIDRSYYDAIGGTEPIYFALNNEKGVGNAQGAKNKATSSNRAKRNMLFSYLTAEEASQVGLEKDMYHYSPLYRGDTKNHRTPVKRIDDYRKKHHISEVTVTLADGSRYVYGSQTYNYRQDEVSFNVDVKKNNNRDCEKTGLVKYFPGSDNSVKNGNGITHYYNRNTLPAHATAYQLTAVLSSDYQDVEGDGPSPDDIGSYTKFNYMTLYTNDDKEKDKSVYGRTYRWRTPYQQDTASYQEGYVCKGSDDKGSYIYGEKEIKLLQSIETKNFIAVFSYDDRDDAYGVKDENGGRSNELVLKKLIKIDLYRRGENGVVDDNAIPVKTVHFDYDYSLCKGIPSSRNAQNSGKLTLKKLYFTYGNSYRGTHMAYNFNYDNNTNYTYNNKNVDRWGAYKDNSNGICMNNPYVKQDKESRDKYASAWLLNSIELPSGSVMNVEYESDDYAYVQNQRSGEMIQILGFGENSDFEYSNVLYKTGHNYNYVYFRADANDEKDFVKRYLTNADGSLMKYLYYKCFVGLTSNDAEYIDGYLRLERSNLYKWKKIDEGKGIACIQLPSASLNKLGSKEINPISKDAMQFVRINMPDLYLGGNRDEKNMGEQLLRKMAGLISEVLTVGMSPETHMYTKGMCSQLDLSRPSFIRLMNPDYARLGDGVRVKEVSIDDQWASMSGSEAENASQKYGSFYKYTKVLKEAEGGIPAGTEISSGVAVYEPHIGAEENSLKSPKYYNKEQNILVNDDYFFLQTPWADAFYPSASVGYSSVSVYDLSDKEAFKENKQVAHQVSEFYTAKDFPIVPKALQLHPYPKHPSLVGRLLNINVKDELVVTQGFSVELNDMHGKPKAERLYAEGQTSPITEKEYYYRTKNGRLDNEITTIDKSGKIRKNVLAGIDVDMATDEREYYSYTRGGSVDINVNVSTLPPPITIPLPIVLPWLNYQQEETRFNSVANTKVVSRYGVLDRIYVRDMGSSTDTRNLLWDDVTGEVLLSSVENEYGDNIYSFKYPAHWAYDAMGPGYKNVGFEANLNTIHNPEKYFTEGDELLMDSKQKGWVSEVNKGYAGSITVVDETGSETKPKSVKVIRSGRHNLQTASVGSVTAAANPIVGDELKFDKVLTSAAVVYDDKITPSCSGCLSVGKYNDFLLGIRGAYRPRASYAYLTGRTQSLYNRNTDITRDGVYTSYVDFWRPNHGWDWLPTPYVDENGNWKFTTEVTIYSPYGMELENRNALGIYSSADFGYNNSLPNCVSNNAMYREIGFTGFEDYNTSKGCQLHFNLNETPEQNGNQNVTNEKSHSGRYSIKVNKKSSYKTAPQNVQQ